MSVTVTVLELLCALAVIVVVARLLGALARRLEQPAVIGEILGGVLLGPTLLHGAISDALFPTEIRSTLGTLSNIGVCVFMFFIGLHADGSVLSGRARAVASVSLISTAVPFGLGVLLALVLADQRAATDHRLAFVLFVGLAMSITALPVLARIVADRGLSGTPVAEFALACAAVGDALAWSMLALVSALAGGRNHPWTVVLIIPFATVLLRVVRPALARLAARRAGGGPLAGAAVLVVLAAALWACAQATAAMGLSLIFGAFLLGTSMPAQGARTLREVFLPRIERFCAIVLLPVFFMTAGLRVNLSLFDATALGTLAVVLVVAVAGKLIGAFDGARLQGIPRPEAMVLAALANTRGLTELVVLTVGTQLGLLDTKLFSQMVIMALVTTAMTGVLLRMLPGAGRPRAVANVAGHRRCLRRDGVEL